LEILGEKALPQGHIDLLLKQRVPLGSTSKIPLEVKTNRATAQDIDQLRSYMNELRGDCQAGILIASDFAKGCRQTASEKEIRLVRYLLSTNLQQARTFEEICESLTLEPV
jgi:RecB family endonuclease NucS